MGFKNWPGNVEPVPDVADLEFVDRLKVAALEPGDVLVVECQELLSQDTANWIKAQLDRVFPGHACIVLDRGVTLKGVYRAADERDG